MSAAVSRRLGRVALLEPPIERDVRERLEIARLAERVRYFEELPERYQQLIIAAEATRERLLAEKRRAPESVA